MILVTGATGHVGRELVIQLAGVGAKVRAMTRRPSSARVPEGVEVVQGDFDDPASLDAALRGVDGVFVMSAQPIGAGAGPTHDLAMMGACRRAREIRRVVKLSVLDGGGADQRDPIVRWTSEAETAVRESGIAWTILRPGRFMSNALAWAPMLRRGNEVSIPFATRPAASIDPFDVAAVAACALTDTQHEGKTYELSGPETLTPKDEVRILAGVLGRSLSVNELPVSVARQGMLKYGMPEHVVDAAIAQTESDRGKHVLSTVKDVTGRPPRRFVDWAEAHAAEFR